jgi:hypothetical protein
MGQQRLHNLKQTTSDFIRGMGEKGKTEKEREKRRKKEGAGEGGGVNREEKEKEVSSRDRKTLSRHQGDYVYTII